IPYFKGDLTGDFLIAVGRPDKTFRVVSRKFRNSVGLAIDAKVLLDGQNRMQRLSFHSITEGGEILPNNLDGISYMIYEHSKDTFVSKQFNAEGELEFVHGVKKTEKGWEIKRVYQADESGLIRNAVFSEDKDKQSGILYQRLEFDFNGNPILNEYQGKFIKSPDGVFIPGPLEDKEGISRIVQNFDLLSNKTLEEYYNASRELKPNKFGIARSVYAYDSYGNPLLVSYLNEKSRRAENEYGISNISYVYDYTINSMGILLQKESFDKSEKLKSGKEGISRFVYKYNKACLEKERKQRGGFDTHYKEWGLDRKDVGLRGKRECLESEEYFETEDKRRARDKRIASRKYSYNQEGYLIGEAYESVLSEPTPVQQGISQVKYTYNENCLLLTKPTDKCSFLDTPCMEKERKEDTTCIQKIEYFGELKDAPASDQYGVAVYEYEYDKNCLLKEKKQSWKNNETLTSCRKLTKALSAGGKETTPTIEPYTYTQYDERGDVTLKEYYDKDGKLKEDENGIARYVFRYDERGNLTLIEYYDKNGKLKEDWRGIARFFYRYNERGKKTLTEYYDKDGKLKEDGDGIARFVYRYEEKGNKTLEEYYDKDGKLKEDRDGIARKVYRYNEKGNLTLTEYYDKEGKLKEDSSGIARKVYRYDEKGNKTLEEYYDKEGKLKEDSEGIARKVYGYNERRYTTLEENYDKDGNLKENEDGIAGYVYRHDERGSLTLIEYYDKERKLKEDKYSGIARKVYKYDEKGNKTLEENYGKEGKLKGEHRYGIARKIFQYDEKEIFELCFNEEEIEVSQNGRNIDKPGRFWFSPEQNYVFQENLEKAFEERWVSRPESKHRTEEAQAEGNSEDSKQSPPKKDKDMVKEKIEYYVVTGGEHHIYFDYEWQGKKRKVDVVTDKFYRPVKLVFRD
ncbi:MAG: hypothetical protein KDK45_14410, partial [Leptospiraceae bacterium]|nr:hypothetical protein [Leptospiraceae bacterium]